MPFDLIELAERFPQLSFEINNPNAPSTIYISNNFSDNRLTLIATTNQPAAFTAGTAVPIGEAANGTGSLLYLSLAPLGLTDQEFEQLTFTAVHWTVVPYSADRTVCFTPLQSVSLASGPGNSINIEIGSYSMSTPPSGASVELSVTYYRVGGITVGNLGIPSSFKEILQNPSDGKSDLHQAVSLTLNQNSIVNNLPNFTMVNSFFLNFGPGNNPVQVLAAADTVFTLTFVYATDTSGYGALTTPAGALGITVERGLNADQWKIIEGADQLNPSWQLQPQANAPIVGTGAQAVVAFNIGNIVTSFQPGPTIMFVSYANVPGYRDGSYAILLEKYPHVHITSLSVSPNPACFQDSVAPVTVSWVANYAAQLLLGPVQMNVTNKSNYATTITQNTTFTLQGSGLPSEDNIDLANYPVTISNSPCSGIYLRMPTRDHDSIGGGPFQSPDVIPFGVVNVSDLSIFTGQFNHSLANPIVPGIANFIYLRGENFTSGAQISRVYLYYAPNELTTVPQNWFDDGFTVNSVAQNWIDFSAQTKGENVVGRLPILWTPTNVDVNTTYSLLAWVVNTPNPEPPDLSVFQTLNNSSALQAFFQQYLNVAVNNNILFYSGTGPISSITVPFSVGSEGGNYEVGAAFFGFPTDASMAIYVPGQNAANTINIPPTMLLYNNRLIAGGVTYPDNFSSTMTIRIYQGQTTIGDTATVEAKIVYVVS